MITSSTYIGRPCKHGNTAPRRLSDRQCTCRQCADEKSSARRARHKADPEKYGAQCGAWAARRWVTHGEFERARRLAWRRGNPDLKRAQDARRRARKLHASPAWDDELTALVAVEAFDLADRRERLTGHPWHVDHMVPLQCGMACGLHTWSNLQVIPAQLNIRKHNRLWLTQPGEWIKHA